MATTSRSVGAMFFLAASLVTSLPISHAKAEPTLAVIADLCTGYKEEDVSPWQSTLLSKYAGQPKSFLVETEGLVPALRKIYEKNASSGKLTKREAQDFWEYYQAHTPAGYGHGVLMLSIFNKPKFCSTGLQEFPMPESAKPLMIRFPSDAEIRDRSEVGRDFAEIMEDMVQLGIKVVSLSIQFNQSVSESHWAGLEAFAKRNPQVTFVVAAGNSRIEEDGKIVDLDKTARWPMNLAQDIPNVITIGEVWPNKEDPRRPNYVKFQKHVFAYCKGGESCDSTSEGAAEFSRLLTVVYDILQAKHPHTPVSSAEALSAISQFLTHEEGSYERADQRIVHFPIQSVDCAGVQRVLRGIAAIGTGPLNDHKLRLPGVPARTPDWN